MVFCSLPKLWKMQQGDMNWKEIWMICSYNASIIIIQIKTSVNFERRNLMSWTSWDIMLLRIEFTFFTLSADKLDAACSLIMALSFGRFGQRY